MRDRRHIMIECYFGQLAPPRLRQHWRRQDKRWGRRFRLQTYLARLLMTGAALAYLASEFVLQPDTDRSYWTAITADLLIVAMLTLVLLSGRHTYIRQSEYTGKRFRRWRLQGVCPLPRGEVSLRSESPGPTQLEARQSYWRWRVGQPLDLGRVGGVAWRQLPSIVFFVVAFYAMSLAWLLEDVWPQSGEMQAMKVIASLAFYGATIWNITDAVRMKRQVLGRIEQKLCPACGYDLHAHEDPPSPPHCPECGFTWPLVLPPAYTKNDLAGEKRLYFLMPPADAPPLSGSPPSQ